jgi:GTP-binding protein Era
MAMRSGVVAIIGKPNVGKSSLVNIVVGQKITIVSNKKQTTRYTVRGIHTDSDGQIVFVDTPGIHKAHTELGKLMNAEAVSSLVDIDLVLVMVDVHKLPQQEDVDVANMLHRSWKYPWAEEFPGFSGIILCLNKMDMLKPEFVLENTEEFCKLFKTDVFMLTSLIKKKNNVADLLKMIKSHLPEGEPLFDESEITDQPMRRIASEMIREVVLDLTKQDVPHAIATLVEVWNESKKGIEIIASIIVEKEGQKAILIGKKGAMIKEIGIRSRREIERLVEKHINLELHVKVRENWRQSARMITDLEILKG